VNEEKEFYIAEGRLSVNTSTLRIRSRILCIREEFLSFRLITMTN